MIKFFYSRQARQARKEISLSVLGVRLIFAMLLLGVIFWMSLPAAAKPLAQETPTPGGPPRVEVAFGEEGVNVRAGPGTEYDLIGRIVIGQSAEIVGQAFNGDFLWYKISYFGGPDNLGWVFSRTTRVIGDVSNIPTISEIPPTPTLPATPTIPFSDATVTPNPDAGRLPTFTPPAAVARPTLLPPEGINADSGSIPPALLIVVLFVIGLFAGLVGLMRSRG